MALKIQELDGETKNSEKTIVVLDGTAKQKDITILISKDVILKLTPQKSIHHINIELQKLSKITNLTNKNISDKIKEIVKLNKSIKEIIDGHKSWEKNSPSKHLLDMLKDVDKGISEVQQKLKQNPKDKKLLKQEKKLIPLKERIQKNIEEMKDIDKRMLSENIKRMQKFVRDIQNVEKKLGVKLTSSHIFCFCPNCKHLVSESSIRGNKICPNCKHKITTRSRQIFDFLDIDMENYLNGDWLVDYISNLLEKLSWKTWRNAYILGASGIDHEIDILAIKKGYVLIAECKTGKISREQVFNFATKNYDIKSNYAFFFSLERLPEKATKDFIKKTPGLDNIENLKEMEQKDIIEKLKNIITS